MTSNQCQKRRSALLTKIWNRDIKSSLKYAVQPWRSFTLSHGLCLSCSQAAKTAYDKARNTNWDRLKSYFGLGDLEDGLDWETSSSDSDSSQSEAVAEELIDDESGL